MRSLAKKIQWRCFRTYVGVGSRIHIRHWRGMSIHSPFMYGMVRKVFMRKEITGSDRKLAEMLAAAGVGKRNSILLQNLYSYCQMEHFRVIDHETTGIESLPLEGRSLCVILPEVTPQTITETAKSVAKNCGTLAILAPHKNPKTWHASRQVPLNHPCVSVDRRVMMLCFFDPKKQTQHYRI